LLQTRLLQFEVQGFQRNIVQHMHLTVCAQCNIIMTSEFVWDELGQHIIDMAIKQ